MNYTIILFYKYVEIKDPESLCEKQMELAQHLDLTGRMIIAEEGLNATFEGTGENIKKYISEMKKDDRFSDIDFKKSPGTGKSFPKLSIKVRDEIVASRLDDGIDPTEDTGTYIQPDELHEWFEEEKDFKVIDMRNSYEYISGHFKNSVDPGMKVFRELPEKVENIEELKDKPVVTVCTGGIRCEKASAFLKEKGFKNVYQLKGGIHRYIEKYPDGYFKGALYVFDGRVTMSMAPAEDRDVVGMCEFCSVPTEHYVDDDSTNPSRQILCCKECFQKEPNLRPASRLEQLARS